MIVGARLLGVIFSAVASMAAPASADLVQSDDQTVAYYGLTFPAVIGDARQISVRDKEIDAAGYGYEVNYDYRGANLTGYEFGPLFIAPAFVIAAQVALAKAVPPPASMPAR